MTNGLEELRILTATLTSDNYLTSQASSWKDAFDSVGELVCITTTSYEIKFINKELAKKLKIEDPYEYIGQSFYSLFKDDLFNGKDIIEKVDNYYTTYSEIYIEDLNGWFKRNKYFIKSNYSEKPIGYTFMLTDITERKEIEIDLINNKNLLEGVLNTIPDVITVQDINNNIIKTNAAAKSFFNKSDSDIIGTKCYSILGRETPCVECQTVLCKESKVPEKKEKYIKELQRWYDCRSYPVLDENNNIEKVIEHLRDITDLKEQEKNKEFYYNRVAQGYKRINFIINSVDGYVWEKEVSDNDSEMTHTFVDPVFCRDFYGLEPEELDFGYNVCRLAYGKKSSDLLNEFRSINNRKHSFGDLCISTDNHCIEQGTSCEYFEMGYIEHVKGKPDWFILRVRKTPLYNEYDECTGILGFANNCSDDSYSIKSLIYKGIKDGRIKKLSLNDSEAKVYWVINKKNEEKDLLHFDFP